MKNYQTYERIATGELVKIRPATNKAYYYKEDNSLITQYALKKYYKWVKPDHIKRVIPIYETNINGFKIRVKKP